MTDTIKIKYLTPREVEEIKDSDLSKLVHLDCEGCSITLACGTTLFVHTSEWAEVYQINLNEVLT